MSLVLVKKARATALDICSNSKPEKANHGPWTNRLVAAIQRVEKKLAEVNIRKSINQVQITIRLGHTTKSQALMQQTLLLHKGENLR